MTETSPESPAAELAGLVCAVCSTNVWKVTHTRPGQAVIRRWRKCANCGHGIRTAERVEAEPHPDRDAV